MPLLIKGFSLKFFLSLRVCILIVAISVVIFFPVVTSAATFIVDRTDDTNAAAAQVCDGNPNNCSLRGAITKANNTAGADTIQLPAGTYTLSILGNNNQDNTTGDLDILDNLTIIGANGNVAGDPTTTIIKGGAGWNDKIIDINPNVDVVLTVVIRTVTVRDGNNTSATDFYGGGIQMFGRNNLTFTGTVGSFTLDNSIVTNNRLTSSNQGEGGGGLLVEQVNATINNCTFSNNSTTDEPGGGIASIGVGNENLTIANSVISGNTTGGDSEGAGIYVRRSSALGRPFLSATVLIDGNTISNNFSHGAGGGLYFTFGTGNNPLNGVSITVQNNVISGNRAGDVTGGQGVGSVARGGGLYWSADDYATVPVVTIPFTLTKNTIIGNTLDPAHTDKRGGGGIAIGGGSMTATFNRFANNTIGAVAGDNQGTGLKKENIPGVVSATNNWWGSSIGPSAAPSDTAVLGALGGGGGSLTSTPFLQLKTTASPVSPLVFGQPTTLTTSFLTNSSGSAISLSNLSTLIGRTVTWSSVGGSLSSQQTTIQANGTATATFTGTAVGAGSATAVVDNGPASGSVNTTAITVNKTSTTTGLTSSQNPSIVGQLVTFTATITVVSPGGGTPTGTVQFQNGGVGIAGCTAVALTGSTAQCALSNLTASSHTITAIYAGDANTFTSNGSMSGNPQVVSNTAVWDGSASGDWNTPANWATNAVPSATNDVSLPTAGVTNQAAIPSGNLTVGNLTVASGRTLNLSGGSLTVNGSLAMNGGDITVTGANVLSIGASGSVTRTSGSVIGTMRKTFIATGSFTYPLGSANGFSPFTFNVTTLTTNPSVLTAAAVQQRNPNPAVPADAINRYWDLNLTSGALTADLTFQYLVGDLPVGNVESAYTAIKDDGTVTRLPVNCGGSPPAGTACVTPATHIMTVKGISSFSKWTAGRLLGPTAANVGITGRVLTTDGRGAAGNTVVMTGQNGNVVYARTNSFGYYRFLSVEAGQTVVLSVQGKQAVYQPRSVSVTDELTDVDFTPLP